MHKIVPLFGIFTATCLVGYSAMQMNKAATAIKTNGPCPWEPPVWSGKPSAHAPDRPPEDVRIPSAPKRDDSQAESGHKLLVRCLGDLDDLLDTVQDRASFESVKPMLLARVRQHVAEGKQHPNSGMTSLSKTAAKEVEAAAIRHDASLTRANRAVPGVLSFFQKEVASLLKQK